MSKLDCNCLRVLRTNAASYSVAITAIVMESRAWASALFVGSRLAIDVKGDEGSVLDEWLTALPEAELTWPGHFVASVDIVERNGNRATIDLLIVED